MIQNGGETTLSDLTIFWVIFREKNEQKDTNFFWGMHEMGVSIRKSPQRESQAGEGG